MREKIWYVAKFIGRTLRNIAILLFFYWVAISIIEIKTGMSELKDQNTSQYNVQAKLFSQMIAVITTIGEYAQKGDEINAENIAAVDAAGVARDKQIVEIIKYLDDRIKSAEVKATTQTQETKPPVSTIDTRPAYDYMKDRIVYMVEKIGNTEHGGIGTGVVIKVDETSTYILTNKHVCDWAEGNSCYVLNDGEKFPITLVKKNDVDHDIQLVKTDRPIPGKVAVRGIKDVVPQERIYFVGNNNANFFMYSEGTVAGFARHTGDLLVGAPSGPGNSGSGIFNQEGYLCGILYAGQVFELEELGGYTMDTAHAICVNSEVLRLFLADYLQ